MAMYQGKYTEQPKPIRTATDKLLSRVEARYKSDVKNKKKLPNAFDRDLVEKSLLERALVHTSRTWILRRAVWRRVLVL